MRINKQIHSCFAACSSEDTMLGIDCEPDFPVFPGYVIQSEKFPFLNGEKIAEVIENKYKCTVYLEADETFYKMHLNSLPNPNWGNLRNERRPDYVLLVDNYLKMGWQDRDDLEEIGLDKELREEREKLENRLRELDGYVIPDWHADFNEYQGRLSDELYADKYLQNYINSGGCHGYIGNSDRMYIHDRFIEGVLREEGYSLREIAVFLCSACGRHFGDSLPTHIKPQELKVKTFEAIASIQNESWFKEECENENF